MKRFSRFLMNFFFNRTDGGAATAVQPSRRTSEYEERLRRYLARHGRTVEEC